MKTKEVVKKTKTKAERRVIILKDVLKQLAVEKYRANMGEYIELSGPLEDQTWKNADKDARTCLIKDTGTCAVCLKGAIFLSLVRKENKVKMGYLLSTEIRIKRSESLFGRKNLNLMEAAFEEWIDEGNNLDDFCGKYPNSTERMIAIVQNAIKNGGIFKP